MLYIRVHWTLSNVQLSFALSIAPPSKGQFLSPQREVGTIRTGMLAEKRGIKRGTFGCSLQINGTCPIVKVKVPNESLPATYNCFANQLLTFYILCASKYVRNFRCPCLIATKTFWKMEDNSYIIQTTVKETACIYIIFYINISI